MSGPDREKQFKEKCESFLMQIERLGAEIEAAASDKKRARMLQRESDGLRRQFATHLGDGRVSRYFQNNKRDVVAHWQVDGVPSKKGRPEARIWMAARGFEWSGAAPSLRSEVLKALNNNEQIPDGSFGLHVEWTVRIATRGWLLLDTDAGHHFVPIRH